MKGFIYIVKINNGCYFDDSITNLEFATTNENEASEWCDKFNKIIENNKERMENYYGIVLY